MTNGSRTRGAARFECDADQAASSAARSSVFAATEISLDGQAGLHIGPEARPAPAFRGADDPQTIEKVLNLSRQPTPQRGHKGVR